MSTAESVFDGLGYVGDGKISLPLSGEIPPPQELPTKLPEWIFFPPRYNDPFGLDDAVLFHAMRRLSDRLLSHA